MCTIQRIYSYRMQIAIDKNVLEIPNPEVERIIHERIIYAINVHRRTMQLVYRILQIEINCDIKLWVYL